MVAAVGDGEGRSLTNWERRFPEVGRLAGFGWVVAVAVAGR